MWKLVNFWFRPEPKSKWIFTRFTAKSNIGEIRIFLDPNDFFLRMAKRSSMTNGFNLLDMVSNWIRFVTLLKMQTSIFRQEEVPRGISRQEHGPFIFSKFIAEIFVFCFQRQKIIFERYSRGRPHHWSKTVFGQDRSEINNDRIFNWFWFYFMYKTPGHWYVFLPHKFRVSHSALICYTHVRS